MIQVVDNTGNLLGYLASEFFISKSDIRQFTLKRFKCSSKVVGRLSNNDVLVNGTFYSDIMKNFDLITYDVVIDLLRSNGLLLNKYILVPCEIEDCSCEEVSTIWSCNANVRNTAQFYAIMNKNNVEAFLMTIPSLSKADDIYIGMFEVLNKGNGIGSEIISQLKRMGYTLRGMSTYPALDFWKRLGAKVDKVLRFNI